MRLTCMVLLALRPGEGWLYMGISFSLMELMELVYFSLLSFGASCLTVARAFGCYLKCTKQNKRAEDGCYSAEINHLALDFC